MKEKTEEELLHRLAAYCSSAERCIQDVEKKIQAAGLPEEAGERIICRLQQEKFIDERRFAQAFVNDKLRFNQWGRVKLIYELRRKAIPAEYIEEAIGSINEADYMRILTTLLKAKLRTLKGKEREQLIKLLRFASGRGFSLQEINNCLKSLGEDVEDFAEGLE